MLEAHMPQCFCLVSSGICSVTDKTFEVVIEQESRFSFYLVKAKHHGNSLQTEDNTSSNEWRILSSRRCVNIVEQEENDDES